MVICLSNFWFSGRNPVVFPIKWNLFGRTFIKTNSFFVGFKSYVIILFFIWLIDFIYIHIILGPFSAEPENVTHAPIVKGSKAASGNLRRTTPKPKQDGQGYRRKRTAFSIRQLQKLETAFRWNMYPGVNVRESLATELGISEACVQVRRRRFLTLKGICHAICHLSE